MSWEFFKKYYFVKYPMHNLANFSFHSFSASLRNKYHWRLISCPSICSKPSLASRLPPIECKDWCGENGENLYWKTARGVGGVKFSADADKPSPHLESAADEHNSPCYTSFFFQLTPPPPCLLDVVLSDSPIHSHILLHNPRLGFTFNLNLFHPHDTFFMRRTTTGNI